MLVSIFKHKGVLISGYFLALLSIGCQGIKKEGPKNSLEKSSFGNDTLTYDFRTIREDSPYYSEHDDQIDTSYASVTYPIFNDKNMDNIIQENILMEGEPDVHSYVQNFIESYGNFVEENNIDHPVAWFKDTKINISLYSPELLCVRNFTYEFTGGAHGNSYENIHVYELVNFKKLALNTFIADDKLKDFTKIAENIFRSDEGLTDTASLDRDYFFEDGKFALSANFGITQKGLLFHYNPYEIKPYAEGTTSLLVPFEKVEGLMTQTGRLYLKKLKDYFQSN